MLIVGYSRAQTVAPAGPSLSKLTAYKDGLGNDANQSLVLPAGVAAGSTLVAVMRLGASRTISTVPAGWSLVGSDTSDTGFHVYKKTAGGTEGGTTATWVTNLSVASAFIFAEVAGAAGAVEVTFAPASLDPPSHAPSGGSANTVWIAVTTARRNDNDVAAPPPGYAGLVKEWSWAQGQTNAANQTVGGAYRLGTAASENPGAFTWSGTVTHGPQACTISVR